MLVQCRPSDVLAENDDGGLAFAEWCGQCGLSGAVFLDYAELQRDPEAVLWDFVVRFELGSQSIRSAVIAVKQSVSRRPLFTVVMTVYQREYLVSRALESVVWQTYADWELRVLADGPHPVAKAAVHSLHTRPGLTGRLTYYEAQHKPGAFGNSLRRLGRDSAVGDYLCFLSHDCLLHPDYLAAHAMNFHCGAGVSVVGTQHWSVPPGSAATACPIYCGTLPKSPPETAGESQIDLTNMAFRTDAARACNIFQPSHDGVYHADYLAFAAVREAMPLRYDSRILGLHF